jgi:hypothetical protein
VFLSDPQLGKKEKTTSIRQGLLLTCGCKNKPNSVWPENGADASRGCGGSIGPHSCKTMHLNPTRFWHDHGCENKPDSIWPTNLEDVL